MHVHSPSNNGVLALVMVARQWRKYNGLLGNQRPLSGLKGMKSHKKCIDEENSDAVHLRVDIEQHIAVLEHMGETDKSRYPCNISWT